MKSFKKAAEYRAMRNSRILDVRIKTVYIDTIPDTRIKNLQDKLYSLKSREQFLVKKLEVMRTQLAFIDSLRIYYARTASAGNSGTSYQEWQRALLFVEKNMDSVNAKSLEAGAQLQDTRNKIALTEDEIRRLDRDHAGDVPVFFRLQVTEGQVFELPLEFPDAQAVGQRRVYLQRFLGNALLLFQGA